MAGEYFSDRENGPKPRIIEEIPLTVWGGIYAIVSRMINDSSFGNTFPKLCFHGPICGYDKDLFINALKAEIPNIDWPLTADTAPQLFTILDFIQFCHKYTAKPKIVQYHSLEHHNRINSFTTLGGWAHLFRDEPDPGHNHFSYDIGEGQREFREAINLIFARNGIIYELTETGSVIRIGPEGLRELLQQTVFHTSDSDLDALLNSARRKFLDPDIDIRKESLEKLWDAWERLKTLEDSDKKKSIALLLERTSTEINFRARLDSEGLELTSIGNAFMIRHKETGKIPIQSNHQVDYLFHRLFSLVYLILKSTNRISMG